MTVDKRGTPEDARDEPHGEDGGTDAGSGRRYQLEEQVGFLLRQAGQRHTAIFAAKMPGGLTPMQFAALAKLHEAGPSSQNGLGRMTAMDVATIKGVVDRLRERGLVACEPDPGDRRRVVVALTEDGRELVKEAIAAAFRITAETVAPLTAPEERELRRLLAKIA